MVDAVGGNNKDVSRAFGVIGVSSSFADEKFVLSINSLSKFH